MQYLHVGRRIRLEIYLISFDQVVILLSSGGLSIVTGYYSGGQINHASLYPHPCVASSHFILALAMWFVLDFC